MCGIYFELSADNTQPSVEKDKQLKHFLQCRGPDSCNSLTKTIEINDLVHRIVFFGTVLWMQGDSLTSQPVEDEFGVLIYNGDIFDTTWDNSCSDTLQIMEKLGTKHESINNRKEHILRVISNLKGPFSMVYYDKELSCIFFCRDGIGRNSLLLCTHNDAIIISSVLGRKYANTVEIPATHVFTLSIEERSMSSHNRNTHECLETRSVTRWFDEQKRLQTMSDDLFNIGDIGSITIKPEDAKLIGEVEHIAVHTKCKVEAMRELLKNDIINKIVDQLTELLKSSVKLRLEAQPLQCKDCIRSGTDCSQHCSAGVLFSGGLDCTILALLADEYLPRDQSIDLINVAFKGDSRGSFDVPDRITGRIALRELQTLRPTREWRLLEVNISEEELRKEQRDTIADLVFPRRTVLDESLGSALWFAARASTGHSVSPCRETFALKMECMWRSETSASRADDLNRTLVLLVGSGADELFGGYTRHRNALRRASWTGLHRELWLDWRRISQRNLARDNRVVSHHGRQPRAPYLDQDFAQYVLQLQPWFRCIPSEACGPGLGDKLYLRLVAFKLGLRQVSAFPKRALQFGSRIANKKENGADISERFQEISTDTQ